MSETVLFFQNGPLSTLGTVKSPVNSEKLLFLRPYFPALVEVCKKYGVEKLYVFGFLVSGDFNVTESDIDFLVRFKQDKKVGLSMLSMMIELEKLFGRKVDLIRERHFQNEYFARSVEQTKMLVYAAGHKKKFVGQ